MAKSKGSCGMSTLLRGEVDVAGERVADHFGLLVNLLGHEMAVIALVDEQRGGERAGHGALHRLAVAVADGDALARHHRPVAVLEIGDGVGEGGERDGVGADEHLAVAIADGERAALAGDDQEIVIAGEDHGERERALQPRRRVIHGAHRIAAALQLAGDEMGDHLGVGVAGEHRALRDQLFLQLAEILDDAVMHDRDEVGRMRMRVGFGRLAVGGPAGMADAGRAVERRSLQQLLEIAQLALGATPAELAILDGGDARANRSRDIRGASARRPVARRPASCRGCQRCRTSSPYSLVPWLVTNSAPFRVATHALCPLVSARLWRSLAPLAHLRGPSFALFLRASRRAPAHRRRRPWR